jgi:nitrogen fixation/metabolism regulation signal transduction histidine kinase
VTHVAVRSSLTSRIIAIAAAAVTAAVALAACLTHHLESPALAVAIAAGAALPLTAGALLGPLGRMRAMFRALSGTVTSYRDGDFSFSLVWPRRDELGELVAAHNELSEALRAQRHALVQRELLLDTMVQNTPVAMLLCDAAGRVVYANLAARALLGEGRRLEGQALATLVAAAPEPMREAVARDADGLFTVERDGEEEIFHLARSSFRLSGRPHHLLVLRRLTAELHREEARTWKRVIRVISHELNNALAPIASLAHSGGELLRRDRRDQLERVFATIAERARHLEQFIHGYAQFAKLPTPRLEPVAWPGIVERLRAQVEVRVDGPLPEALARVDPAQLDHALANLVRNAHESGSPPEDVQLRVRCLRGAVAVEVCDRGPGMSDTVLANALLPFYSTKRDGTGLGLALVREIAEAHGGRVALANRAGGGLIVTLVLPQ